MTQEAEKDQKKEDEEEIEEEQQRIELPPVNFENFILGMYNTALIHMGIRDPETGRLIRNLPLARHTIDTLGMIQEKTRGNLTAPEGNLLENLLYELRMNYLRAVRQTKDEEEIEEDMEPEETQEAADEATDEDSS